MPLIGLISVTGVTVISAGPTLGQTNIDQGKPASELFANYCAVCHKSTRGLANGRSSLMLSLFLREHYAASSQQAAALAAYVIGAGGNAPPAKPERAKSEEPKGQEAKGHEAKPRAASAKSEPEKPDRATQPGREEAAPTQQQLAPVPAPVVAAPVVAAPVVAAPVVAPAASPPPSSGEATELRPTSAGVSAESGSNDDAPVPRDNIPD
jgi:hypothetical protein